MRRRRFAVGALALGVVTLTGCSGLPRSGPIERGYEVDAPYFAPIRVKVDPPKPGASPERIVEGFIAAGTAPEDDHAAARAFLTQEASSSWDPDDGVVVFRDTDGLGLRAHGPTRAIQVPLVNRIDTTGRYLTASPGETASAEFRFAKVDGEWRISRLPDGFGLWLDQASFGQLYGRFAVTYADPSEHSLMSDYRWVPVSKGPITALARLQLLGVPTYLRGTATTGFPPQTQLAVESVPIVDGIAQIDLRQRALEATPEERATAWAQMLRTMQQIPGVKGVSITAGGAPFQVDGITGLPTSVAELGFVEPRGERPAVVLRRGETLRTVDLVAWTKGEDRPVTDEVSLAQVPSGWERLSITRDLSQVAAVDARRTRLFRRTADAEGGPTPFGTNLTEPAMDIRGRVWLGGVDAAGASRIWGVDTAAAPTAIPQVVPAPWVSGRVTAVKPSPAGRRLAVALTDARGVTSIHVAGIRPRAGAFSASLGEPWRVATGLTDLRDLTWADDKSLAVIAARAGTATRPLLVPLGGPVEPLAAVKEPRQITSTGGARGVIVVSENGSTWRRVGSAWRRQDVATELIVPGT